MRQLQALYSLDTYGSRGRIKNAFPLKLNLPTYLPTYLPDYLPNYLTTYLLTLDIYLAKIETSLEWPY